MAAKDTRIDLDRYASNGEAVVARRIVRLALANGWTISVYNGEEWTVKQSPDRMTILSALASTEMDTLRFRKDGQLIGSIVLVWGNDADGTELIADYSVTGESDDEWTLFINELSRLEDMFNRRD